MQNVNLYWLQYGNLLCSKQIKIPIVNIKQTIHTSSMKANFGHGFFRLMQVEARMSKLIFSGEVKSRSPPSLMICVLQQQ